MRKKLEYTKGEKVEGAPQKAENKKGAIKYRRVDGRKRKGKNEEEANTKA
jgi:hypothetical protein